MRTITSCLHILRNILLVIAALVIFSPYFTYRGLIRFYYFMIHTIKKVSYNLDKTLKIRKRLSKVMDYWLHILTILGVTGIFYFSFKLEIAHNKATSFHDLSYWLDNLVPNIIADMIGIILTTFIIAGLFSRNNKIAEEKRLYKIIGFEFEKLIIVLCRNYLYILRRDIKYMNFSVSDEEIKREMKTLAKEKRPISDPSAFIKPFEVMDISDGSYIFDNFVVMAPKIKKHLELMDLQYNRRKALSSSYELELYYLENIKEKFGENSLQYRKKSTYCNRLKQELEDLPYVFAPIKKEHLYVEINQVFYSLRELFKIETNKFSAKYNTLLPLEIRLMFSDMEKNVSYISSNISQYKEPLIYTRATKGEAHAAKENQLKEATHHITKVSEQLLELANYFNNTKRFI